MGVELEKKLLEPYRFTVEEYHQMGEAGILPENARVELLNGEIVTMSPISSPHSGMVKKLNRILSKLLGDQLIVSIQDPIELGPDSEPEPDVALLKMRPDLYSESHPQAADVLVVIEVESSSIQKDRQVKIPLYAESGIPETWLIDLQGKAIEVYTLPTPGGYSRIEIFRTGDRINTTLVRDLPVKSILG